MAIEWPYNTLEQISWQHNRHSVDYAIKLLKQYALAYFPVDEYTVLPDDVKRIANAIFDAYNQGWEDGHEQGWLDCEQQERDF